MSLIPRDFYLDDIFDDMSRFSKSSNLQVMKCDIYEEGDNYNIEIDIPGYEKKDISIECDDGMLTIVAEKKNDDAAENENKRYIRRERVYGKVSRSFSFADIDEDNITADFNNGVLSVVIPKAQKKETKRKIEIN